MALKRAPTLEGLERATRRALGDSRVRISCRDLSAVAALVEWDGDGARGASITVDPYQRGLVYLVVHELIHWVKRSEAETWGELEEPQVDGLSVELTRRIEGSRRRMAWWRSAIRAKLKGAI